MKIGDIMKISGITIVVKEIKGKQVRVGFDAPKEVKFEFVKKIKGEK